MQEFQTRLKDIRESLGMETAIIASIDGNEYQIQLVDSKIPVFKPGDVFELSNTYCEAVKLEQKTITYNNVGAMPKMRLHPVYVMMQLLSYIGTPINNNGAFWGTLNFSSTTKRESGFTDDEIKLCEAFAQQIGKNLS